MRIDILTLFPAMFRGFVDHGLIRIASDKGLVTLRFHDVRDQATDVHRSVDDRPFGGGPGMILRPDTVAAAVEEALEEGRLALGGTSGSGSAPAPEPRLLMLTPAGRRLDQALLRDMAGAPWLVLLCGHYEGFDERVRLVLRPEEVSIGDYVLSGGEVGAMVIADGVARLVPGVLGDERSASEESFEDGLLEYPQYTRPRTFRGLEVPEVLLSGDHGRVASWRREQAQRRTRERRSDLEAAPGNEGVRADRPEGRTASSARPAGDET